MSLIFSRRCEYAVQGVLYLALKPEGEMTSIRELAGRFGIPYHFLGKILQSLKRKGLLHSTKGPSGGFCLGMPARDITLFHIIEAVDGTDFMRLCVMGFGECTEVTPCSAHSQWQELREGIYRMLVNRNMAEMAREMQRPEYRDAKQKYTVLF